MGLNILLLEGVHESADADLAGLPGAEITRLAHAPDRQQLAQMLPSFDVVGLRSRTQLDADALRAAPRLKAVGAFCTGTNNIDLGVALERGVAVFNGPFSNTRSVAELVVGHAIHLLRRIPERHAAARRGGWMKDAKQSSELRGKTLGIVGYGKIGTQTGLLAEALGMQVLYFDVEPRLPLGNAARADSLESLLQAADVVTLHVPQTPLTRQMMDAHRIGRMRPGSVLINLARGEAVDLQALRAALTSGHLRGAALDVFPTEPRSASERFECGLEDLDNVILTPHVGGSTVEAQRNLGLEVARKLRDYVAFGAVSGSVNLPDVPLGALQGAARLVHVHADEPGVLSHVHGAISAAGLNVSQVQLKTTAGVGIAVIDVDGVPSAATLDTLRGIAATRRLFVASGTRGGR